MDTKYLLINYVYMIFEYTNQEIKFLNKNITANEQIWELNEVNHYNLDQFKFGYINENEAKQKIAIYLTSMYSNQNIKITIDKIENNHQIKHSLILKLAQRIFRLLKDWQNQQYEAIISQYLKIKNWQSISDKQLIESAFHINKQLISNQKVPEYVAVMENHEICIKQGHENVGAITFLKLTNLGELDNVGAKPQTIKQLIDGLNIKNTIKKAQTIQQKIGKQFPTQI